MVDKFQMYLIVLALFVMYRNWEFYKILRGVTAKQIVADVKKEIDELIEEVSAASETLPHWTVILSSSFSITFFLLVDVSYFALTIYFFRSPLFLAFTLICILWTLYLWPGLIKDMVQTIRDGKYTRKIKEDVWAWLKSAFLFTHALLVIAQMVVIWTTK